MEVDAMSTISHSSSNTSSSSGTRSSSIARTTAERSSYFMRKKRKLYLFKMLDALITLGSSSSHSSSVEPDCEPDARFRARRISQKSSAPTAAPATAGEADGRSLCLICRQHVEECCAQCCQRFAKKDTPPTAAAAASNERNCSDSLNKNNNNSNRRKSETAVNDSNYQRRRESATRRTATSDGSCWQHSSCTSSSLAAARLPSSTAQLHCSLAVCECECDSGSGSGSDCGSNSNNSSSREMSSSCSCCCHGSCSHWSNTTTAAAMWEISSPAAHKLRQPSSALLPTTATTDTSLSAAALCTATAAVAEQPSCPMSAIDSSKGNTCCSSCAALCYDTNDNHNNSNNDNNNHNNNNQIATKSANKACFILFRNALRRTFQCLILFVQMQLLQTIFNNHKNNYSKNNVNANDKFNKNNNNNNNHKINKHNNNNKRQQHQAEQQQQCPPLPRLNLLSCNSYLSNATITVNEQLATQQQLPQHQQHQHRRQQRHQHHHHHHHHSPQQLMATPLHCEKQQQQQSLASHFRRCNWPNLSHLCFSLTIFVCLSMLLPTAQAQNSLALANALSPATATATAATQRVNLTHTETVCKSMDLRNSPVNLRALRNCTVIEGFLLILLFNSQSLNGFPESYPLLTEISDFLVIYNVNNLRSLSQIFPNLRIIRGRTLFEGYAFIVYSNPHLEELGLSSLTSILRGGVRIENNLSLCFVETIDWKQIVSNATDNIITKNRAAIECPKCPGVIKSGPHDTSLSADKDLVCNYCWSSKSCQKICPAHCPNSCIDENTCCNEACLGSCSPNNPNECTNCRHYSIYANTCLDECPNNFYKYLDRRCVSAEECSRIGTKFENNKEETLVAYNGSCDTRCPAGYNKVNGTCVECGEKCERLCDGNLIDSVERAKLFHGCTIIQGNLTISIKRGGRHLMEDLEFGLSSIEVIEGYLRVHRTFGMFSLEFFKHLRRIEGKYLYEDKFSLYVLENNDLEAIWNPYQTVRLEEGRVFFHFNPKLCYSEIDALRPMMKHSGNFDKNEVATDSNGSKGSCNTEVLNTTVVELKFNEAKIEILNPLEFDDERAFIGYRLFYMEDKYGNETKHSSRPCDDSWSTTESFKDNSTYIRDLEPFTQYAYYIKTLTISSEPRNAQSNIQYFKTKSSQPDIVQNIGSYSNSSSEIVLTWLPPTKANGNLTKYNVRAVLNTQSRIIESRNYCKDPAEINKDDSTRNNTKDISGKNKLPANCNCEKDKSPNTYENQEEVSEAVIDESISFENTLQNFVYVKHLTNSSRAAASSAGGDPMRQFRRRRNVDVNPMDSFLIRHMRRVPDPELEESSTASISTTTVAPLDANKTHMDTGGQYYEYIIESVNVTTNAYVFEKLKHFSIYEVGVQACREPEEGSDQEECSSWLFLYQRTGMLADVDIIENLQIELEGTNTSRSNVRMRWEPPVRPNGAVVSYTIVYELQAQDAVEEKKCIAEVDYRNMSQGYLLTGLSTGNYSIKVIANSLAGKGIAAPAKYIYIPPSDMTPTTIALICIGVIVLLIAAVVVYYCMCKRMTTPSDLKIFPTVNPYYISLQYIPDDWEVARDRVLQLSPLGQGSFGMVYEGILKGYNNSNDDTPCAIKTVNENATDRERMNFLNEASVMKQFDTYHVVRLLGVCSVGQPALVVMELMKNGDLKSYLRAHRPDERDDGLGAGALTVDGVLVGSLQPPPLSRIYQMAIEIADGMAYLAAKKFVHRDLAARNCMVAADLTVKIGDFGMTRDIYETDYYRKGTKGLLPVRWMPPESLRDGVYSTASDVFSYGVVLWEMATLASQPYQGLTNDQVLRYVIEGGVMERPENCPDKLYSLMQRCWHHRPSARPGFMDIIRFLLDLSDSHFHEVSFYHSDEGQQVCAKELAESIQRSGDVFSEHDNDMDDVTTPLRMGEYNEYKLHVENNSSVENHGDSPMVMDDDHPNSPYSLGSAAIISSTPDGQSKNSFNLSQMSHNNPTLLSSAPSTSAGAVGGFQSAAYKPTRRHNFPDEDASEYVLPDPDVRAFGEVDELDAGRSGRRGPARTSETDERGYEVYDPSPNYRKHRNTYDAGEDEEDFDGIELGGGGKLLSGGQNLLPRQKVGRQRVPTIMPMSSSMPDEVISVPPMSSSLHPSTASAASSNASSTATATGKYPSLKRAVADTVQNVGHSLMPARLRNINRFFHHKRSGSNASHKSTSSNPNTSYNSNTNLTGGSAIGAAAGVPGKSTSGQNLGTIESGGSGSAGSYCPAPRFYTPVTASAGTSTATTTVSENPNYKLLDESANTSGFSVGATTQDFGTPTRSAPTKGKSLAATLATSSNPNYKLLDETLNTTAGSPVRPGLSGGAGGSLSTSENPNYELMQAPAEAALHTTDNPNYVMMNRPSQPEPPSSSFVHISMNPNYTALGPQQHYPAPRTFPAYATTLERCHNSATPSSASSPSSSEDERDDEDDEHTEHIKMERMPLSRRRGGGGGDHSHQKRNSRSRSRSQTKSEREKSGTPTAAHTSSMKGSSTAPSSTRGGKSSVTYSLKEKWLRQQQQPPPPPPNGFIGRET